MLRRVLYYRNLDGVCTKAMDTLTGGPFLAGLALALGASNLQIGLIAAIPFLSKIMFIPSVWVVERFRRRRLICVVCSAIGRPLLLGAGLAPFWLAPQHALWLLMVGLGVYSVWATVSGLAWNAWMRHLLPDRIRGRVFSRRLWTMGVVGMALSLGGALAVDGWTQMGQPRWAPLAALFVMGAAAGIVGVFFLNRIPEQPTARAKGFSLGRALRLPFQDRGFKRLIAFSGAWSFATNLALPFITVYMLSALRLPFLLVMAFTVASQLANLAFLNIWGRVADRYGNKAVLYLCTPVFSLSLLLWTFTVAEQQWLSLALIALIHVMNGMATAGIDVANDNLLFQLAPRQMSTPYFASAALVNSMAAGVAPILGGVLANAFESHTLSIQFNWDAVNWSVARFSHLDFVFLAAFLFGGLAFNRLMRVPEREHEARSEVVVHSIKQEIQNIASIRGMRHLTQAASFFAGLLLDSGKMLTGQRKPENKDP